MNKPAINQLLTVMAKLRSPKGCPWDREQDHMTLRRHAIVVYDDRDWMLIDIGYSDTVDEIVELIRQMDFPLARCQGIVATHADVDHAQGLARAKQLLKSPVLAHPLAIPALETGDRLLTFAEISGNCTMMAIG